MNATILSQLAQLAPSDMPVLSVYLDVRPLGSAPEERGDLVKLTSRFHAIAASLWPRGDAYTVFERDMTRIEEYLANDLPRNAEGVAIFVDARRDLFMPVIACSPFSFEVAYAPTFQLFQLAKLLENTAPTAVVVIDRETARLFLDQQSALIEIEDLDENARNMRKTHFFAGAGIRHYERHYDEHRKRFAHEIATELERIIHDEHIDRIILAGNQEALPWLRDELPAPLMAMLYAVTLPMAIDSGNEEIRKLITPIIQAAEADAERAYGDRVIEAVRSHGLGVVGLEATRAMLATGQVDTLVMTDDAEMDLATRNELVRLALATRARVEPIGEHAILSHNDGVGALLRYRATVPAPLPAV